MNKPILFSTPMVQAIMNGTKTQTRRIIKPQPDFDSAWKNLGAPTEEIPNMDFNNGLLGVSYGKGVGHCVPNVKIRYTKNDILWVRETFYDGADSIPYIFKAGYPDNLPEHIENIPGEDELKWKPSIFMPKNACRIFLEITNIRVERLQDISEDDATAEGVMIDPEGLECWDYLNKRWHWHTPICSFETLWHAINGAKSWDENPWLWVVEFEKCEKPENWPNYNYI